MLVPLVKPIPFSLNDITTSQPGSVGRQFGLVVCPGVKAARAGAGIVERIIAAVKSPIDIFLKIVFIVLFIYLDCEIINFSIFENSTMFLILIFASQNFFNFYYFHKIKPDLLWVRASRASLYF